MKKKKTGYYSDRIKIRRKRDNGFIGGYRTIYKDNYVKVKILGRKTVESPNCYWVEFLIELPNKQTKVVNDSELFI